MTTPPQRRAAEPLDGAATHQLQLVDRYAGTVQVPLDHGEREAIRMALEALAHQDTLTSHEQRVLGKLAGAEVLWQEALNRD